MKNNRFKWLCYATAVLLTLIFIAAYIQLNRYEPKYTNAAYDKLTNKVVPYKK